MERTEDNPRSQVLSAVIEDSGEEAWVIVVKAGSRDLADLSLVLSAVGIDQQIDRQNGVILTQKKMLIRP